MSLSEQVKQFDALLQRDEPVLALAPMQDVTDLPFWKVIRSRGGADVYYTEYFRVHADSRLEKPILRSITENPTGRPVVAQMIGNSIPDLVRTARELQQHPIAAVDLNLGCPAPVVYKKCAGGGLLREPERVDRILGALREAVETRFTVKTRIGFDDPDGIRRVAPDLCQARPRPAHRPRPHGQGDVPQRRALRLHRTRRRGGRLPGVGQRQCLFRSQGRVGSRRDRRARPDDRARDHPQSLGCSPRSAGISAGEPPAWPSGREVLEYVADLFEMTAPENYVERSQVQKMKKYMNYFGLGVDPAGRFLHDIRRAQTKADFFAICREHLDHDEPMPLEPYTPELQSRDVVAGIHT